MTTVLITGASDGIGRSLATALAASADAPDLVLLGRDPDKLSSVAPPGARTIAIDLVDPSAAADAVRELALHSLDAVVHSAGISDRARIADADEAHWQRQIAINLLAPIALTRALLEPLRAASGTVLFVNSVVALGGAGAGGAAYAASKTALRSFAQQLRLEEPDLRVASVYPGRVATAMQRSLRDWEGAAFEPERYAHPDDVAAALRTVLDAPAGVSITDLTVLPRHP